MSPVHFHLAFNHVPVIGMGLGLALLVYALILRKNEVRVASQIVLVFVALITIPVYLAGEGAEDVAEKLPGVEHEYIEEHEDAALYAIISIEATGLAALIGLLMGARPAAAKFSYLVALIALFATATVGRTAWLGGHIRHTEIRPGAASHD